MMKRFQTLLSNFNLRHYSWGPRRVAGNGGAVQVDPMVDPGYPVVFAVDPTLAFRHFQGLSGAFSS